jgi:hypothetical protein
VAIGENSTDHFVSLAARGEFTPKLTGRVDVGLTRREFSGRSSVSLLGVDGSLTYALSPKTNLQWIVSNDFDTNSQGQQQKNTAVSVLGSASLLGGFSATAGLTYRTISYYESPARTDHYFEGQLGLRYSINDQTKVVASYVYRRDDSRLIQSDFAGQTIGIAVNLRY